ncbi:MAG: four helix bundle protein [Kiritimatiellia bacterium]|jgi:four helix bundle protein
MSMFGGTGGYFRLDSWILANIVQLGTQRFCKRFLNRTNDPCGRQYDQMTQAARSGCSNIAEGSARHATSRETEMKLTDVARSSLAELAGDYLNWLLQQEQVPLESQGEAFKAEGGFREKLSGIRVEARARQQAAPVCPDCGKPMARRKARSGKNAGREFWGCTGYPECRGAREMEGGEK